MSTGRFTALAIVGSLLLFGAAPRASGNTLVSTCNGVANGCDQTGSWYTSPVTVSWDASPVPSNSEGCQTRTYLDTRTTVTCQVWWGLATAASSFPLNIEASAPSAVMSAARPPDSSGWYNHPLTAATVGQAFSGIASCTAPTYAGPDSATALLAGSCIDNAGKVATATITFRYDSTPPVLQVLADPRDGTVRLSALVTDVAPMASLVILRRRDMPRARNTTLVLGRRRSLDDARLRNGVRYRYTFIARDAADNVSERTVTVVPGPRLLAPVSGAVVAAPPLLRWTPVRHADYYNVQVYRGAKVLSRWPSHASLQLTRDWTFGRHHYHLRAGRYHWYVWPGFGPRSAARYGHLIGSRTFTVAG